jgi:membrane protein required for colicin V production
MTWFDGVVLTVIVLSVGFAVIRGALREIGTLLVLALAAGAAFLLLKPLQALFGVGGSFMATIAIAGALGLVGFAAFYFLLHVVLERLTMSPRAARVDRIAGGVFGLARGLVIIGLGFLAYSYYLGAERQPESVKRSITYPVAKAVADLFEGLAPESTGLTPPPDDETEPAANAAIEGYARGDRAALAEIVTTVTTTDRPEPAVQETETQLSADQIADILRESDPE